MLPDMSPPTATTTRLRDLLVAAVLPQDCALCGAGAGLHPICAACAAELPPPAPDACPQCGDSSALGAVCGACRRDPPAFAATVVGYRYAPPVDRLIQRLKFAGALHLAPWFARRLEPKLPAGIDAVLAVPLHPNRLRERGYNQARELAVCLARSSRLPLRDDLIRRSRDTAHQAELDAEARRRNLKQAFACPQPITGSPHLLLVDDVMTTGASAREIAATLLAAGAGRVSVAVAARTP